MKANPDEDISRNARQLVMTWVSDHVPRSTREGLDGDLLGQLADSIAWAMDTQRIEDAKTLRRGGRR